MALDVAIALFYLGDLVCRIQTCEEERSSWKQYYFSFYFFIDLLSSPGGAARCHCRKNPRAARAAGLSSLSSFLNLIESVFMGAQTPQNTSLVDTTFKLPESTPTTNKNAS